MNLKIPFKFIFTASIIFFTSYSYAETFVCPDTYQSVATGYTTEQVRAACGNPTNTDTQSGVKNIPVTIEQWVYTASSAPLQMIPAGDKQEAQLIVTFNHQGVVESVTTQNATTMTGLPCHDFTQIQVGATKDNVQMQCGSPTSINTIQRTLNEPLNLSVWTYNYGQYKPQMLFAFQDDKLVEMRMGQLGK